MDILCTYKTGTLTEGFVQVEGAYDASGAPSTEVMDLGACNAALETGIASPLDEAILKARTPDLRAVRKISEIPFDFVRKRVTGVVQTATGTRLITKGAFHHVVEICTCSADGTPLTRAHVDQLERRYAEWSRQGIRVLAIAARSIDEKPAYSREDERDLTFMGFLTFLDRPKAGVSEGPGEPRETGRLSQGDHRRQRAGRPALRDARRDARRSRPHGARSRRAQ